MFRASSAHIQEDTTVQLKMSIGGSKHVEEISIL